MPNMDLRKSKYILPNLFTLASVFFGLLAALACFQETDAGYKRAAIAILVAMIADSLDGRVARMTKSATDLGVQLDSLADALSFGMVPAILAYSSTLYMLDEGGGLWGIFLAFMYVATGILRLARFNVLANRRAGPKDHFLGLPIPGGAGMMALGVWAAIDLAVSDHFRLFFLGITTIAVSALMVSNVRYRNFKNLKMTLPVRLGILILTAIVIVVAIKTRASVVLYGLVLTYTLLGPAEWLIAVALRVRGRKRPVDTNSPPGI